MSYLGNFKGERKSVRKNSDVERDIERQWHLYRDARLLQLARNPDVSGIVRVAAVHLLYMNRHDRPGESWPSQTLVAQITGLSKKQVGRCNDALHDLGWHLQVEEGRGSGRNSAYRGPNVIEIPDIKSLRLLFHGLDRVTMPPSLFEVGKGDKTMSPLEPGKGDKVMCGFCYQGATSLLPHRYQKGDIGEFQRGHPETEKGTSDVLQTYRIKNL